LPQAPAAHGTQPSATRVARRFAMAWQRWDTGKRSSRDGAVLHALATPQLWRRLRAENGAALAVAPRQRTLRAPSAVAVGGGQWRAVLMEGAPSDRYLATLVIAATPAGPRVAAIEA
jgi:hypothetical protein